MTGRSDPRGVDVGDLPREKVLLLAHLHVAAELLLVVDELALGRLERVADRSMDVGAREALLHLVRLPADDELVSRHEHVDVDVEDVTGAMLVVQFFDRNAAVRHPVEEALELGDPLPDLVLDRLRGLAVVERDLERGLEHLQFSSSPL